MLLHSSLPLGESHLAHNWEYADSTARLAATGFIASDVHKLALQNSDHTLWILTSISPTVWQGVATAGAGDVVGPASATNSGIATFDGVTGKLIKNNTTLISDLVPKSTLTAKGSILTASASATPTELLVGPNGTSPIADSAEVTGIRWQNVQAVAATPATILYPNTAVLQAITAENAYEIDELNKSPALGVEAVNAMAVTVANSPLFDEMFLYDTALGFSSVIPAGIFEFHTFCSVDSIGGGRVSSIRQNMYLVEVGTGTLATTGTGTTRTATITTGTPFLAGDYNANRLLTSFIRTPTGLHMVTGYTSSSVISIDALAGYTNETAVAYTIYRFALGGTSNPITTIGTNYQPVATDVVVATSITLSATTKLAYAIFGISNDTTTVNFIHNGTTHYSHVHTTMTGLHNDLPGLNAGDYKHLTAVEYGNLSAGKALGSDINTGTNDTKFVTPLAIANSTVMIPLNITIPVTGLTGGAATITLTAAQNKATSIEVVGTATTNIVIVTADTMPPFVAENIITAASGFTITFKTAAGTGVVIPDGVKAILYANGTNVESMTGAAGTGDMILAAIQSVTGLKTFDTTKLAVKGSSTGTTAVASANTSASNFTTTLPAATITVAGLEIPQTFTKTQSVTVISLTSTAASIAVDLSLSNNFSHTMTENTTLAAPSNAVAGTSGQITFTQHASAAKTLAFHANWISTDGTTPVISTTVGTVNLLTYYVVDSTHIWFALNKHGVA